MKELKGTKTEQNLQAFLQVSRWLATSILTTI